ncbi:MAG: hypothetical protein ABSA44_09705 [Bacteroidota bacterium]|jgi:hypothetical protein
MKETNLQFFNRTHPSRIYTNKTLEGERQCAVWVNSPDDTKNMHAGNRLYEYSTSDGKKIWLCKTCLEDMANISASTEWKDHTGKIIKGREYVGKQESIIPLVSAAFDNEGKSNNVTLTINHGKDNVETIKYPAWPAR